MLSAIWRTDAEHTIRISQTVGGRGIPDDVHAEEFGEIIKKIDADGVSDYHVERYGMDMIWDYRMFDFEAENCLLKVGIARIREAYEYEE